MKSNFPDLMSTNILQTTDTPLNNGCLEWRNITFRYSTQTDWECRIENLQVGKGEVLMIIGANGSGKSTLLKLGGGLLTPGSGKIMMGDVELARLDRKSIARRLGYLPQNITPYFNYTVSEVVRLGRYPHLSGFGRFAELDQEAVEEAMTRTEVSDLQNRRLDSLSGGEAQRAFLASILAQSPDLLLLDEPTNSLDVHHQVAFFRLIRQLKEEGAGFVVVTHDLNLASLFADRLVLMKNGTVLTEGTPEEVLTEEYLSKAYGNELLTGQHPQCRRPIVLPAVRLT